MFRKCHRVISIKFINKKLLGKEYELINRLLDSTTQLSGPHHRRDYVHTARFIIQATGGDPEKVAAALAHIRTDNFGITVKRGKKIERIVGIDRDYEIYKMIRRQRKNKR